MRWIVVLGITVATFAGCSLEEALENAPCVADEDCLGEQTCVKTAHQEATGQNGLCRSAGGCWAGEQEGCVTRSDGTCDYLFYVICDDASGTCYCCEGQNAIVIIDPADPSSAQCMSGDVIDSECDVDTDCAGGQGLVCTRTLEQQAEPASAESLPENQAEEPGWCRPSTAPECVQGEQEGCRTDSGCQSSQTRKCAENGRCYCCDTPTDTNQFEVHVYEEADDQGSSAACVECPRNCTSGTDTCTDLEDPTCEVPSGVCGCTPMM